MKLFPVALAVLALASCSNDDLLNIDGQEVPKDANNLYVTVEPLQDGMDQAGTRAGFVYGTTASGGSHGQYLVWTKGDQVKIYDDNQNWRPQLWEFNAAATKAYKKSEGFSVFSVIKEVAGQEATETPVQYTNAYGVVPADLGSFTNENRSEFTFDLSGLANYKLDRTAVTDVYTDGYLAKAPIPMWGVATSADGTSEMKVKYLTGILKVDIAQLPATTGTNHNWLVVQSKANNKQVKLHPAKAAAEFDPETVEAAPALKVEIGTETSTDLTTGTITIEDGADDLILIDLGTNLATATPNLAGKRCCIAVPIVVAVDNAGDPVEQELSAYLYSAVAANATTLTNANKVKIGESITKTVAAGTMYLIQDDVAVDAVANTPYDLATKIKELDAAASRPININITSDINVDDTGDDEHGYVIDLSDYALKNDVNVAFTSAQFEGKTASANTLEIRTKAGGKGVLTINVPAGATNALKAVKVDNKLAGALKLTGTIANVEAGSKNLTIAATVEKVNATDEVTIDGGTTGTITTLNVNTGCTKVTAKSGTITTIAFGAYNATPANNKEIAAPVEIATIAGHIGAVDFTYVPTNKSTDPTKLDFAQAVTFTSEYAEAASDANLTQITNCDGAGNFIISAAQLIGYGYSANAKILAKTIDMKNVAWKSTVYLAKEVDGNYNVLKPTTSTKDLTATPTTISNLGSSTATTNATGLFNSLADAATVVKNINFAGTNYVVGAKDATGLGLIANTATAAATIQDVTIGGTNTVKAAGNSKNLGGLVGAVSGNLKIANVKVTGLTIEGYTALGGYVGQIAASANVTVLPNNGSETYPTAPAVPSFYTAPTVTITVHEGEYPKGPAYAKIGKLVGEIAATAAATTGQLTLYQAALPTLSKTDAGLSTGTFSTAWTVSDAGNFKDRLVVRTQDLVGFSGVYNNSGAPAAVTSNVLSVIVPNAGNTDWDAAKNYTGKVTAWATDEANTFVGVVNP